MKDLLPEGHVPFLFPKTLDNTILSTWCTCKRKAFFAHLLHLHPKNLSIHLKAGAAYAAALEAFRVAYWDASLPTFKDQEASMLVAFRALLVEYGYENDEQVAFEDSTNKGCWRMAEALVRHFQGQFIPTSDAVRPWLVDGKPAVEYSFSMEFPIQNPDTMEPILYHGRFDMIAEFQGGHFAYDDKTTSQLGVTWMNQWDTRSQFTGYCAGSRQQGLKLDGVIVRGHCFLKGDVKFAECISHRKDWQLDEWEDNAHEATRMFIAYYERAKAALEAGEDKFFLYRLFPAEGKFNGACDSYSGCPFKELCLAQHPQRYLDRYRIRVWDPTNPGDD